MSRLDELRLMAKVARLYYDGQLTQPQIAERMHLSQATVSRLLKRAEQEKIVRITVSQPQGAFPELEEALQRRYRLKDVIVADCPVEDDAEILHCIGSAAAFYLETTIDPQEVIGISSWSETLLEMVDALQPLQRTVGARVVQILGGMGNPGAQVHANNLTRHLASRLRSEPVFLPAPGVVPAAEARAVYLEDPFVHQAVNLFEKVTLALVGIGAVEPSAMLARSGNTFEPRELDLLRTAGAVGDICLRFFDCEGVPVITPLDERVMGMALGQLHRAKRAVGVAGGSRKLAAIRGALNGGWINVLVTDHFTASRLLA